MAELTTIATGGLFMAALGIVLAGVLAFANRKLYVYEDPRIDEVEAMLPHSNCGACGVPGCRQFAEALVAGSAQPGACTVSTNEGRAAIAQHLGVEVGAGEKRVARLACGGGSHLARLRAHYEGLGTCRAAHLVGGGGKGCAWGCLGLGDCEQACGFGAIELDAHGLPVVDTASCTACNDCVEICPRGLFSIHPISHQLWVACKNEEKGEAVTSICEVACDGCRRCEQDAPQGLIRVERNLAIIDYDDNEFATRTPIERCPTGAIVWLDEQRGPLRGRGAKKIVREEPLPIG